MKLACSLRQLCEADQEADAERSSMAAIVDSLAPLGRREIHQLPILCVLTCRVHSNYYTLASQLIQTTERLQ